MPTPLVPIAVMRIPLDLADSQFTSAATLVDPADGHPVDALTVPQFQFVRKAMPVFETIDAPPTPEIAAAGAPLVERLSLEAGNLARAALAPRGRFFRLDPKESVLSLTPGPCRKRAGVVVAGALLAHEQAHWDIFFLGARRIAHRLAALRAASEESLLRQADAIAIELDTASASNVNAAQGLYDAITRHGADALWQGVWLTYVRLALADPDPAMVGPALL